MTDPGSTVRVSGLPTHTDEDRLRDKLFIHFLRARHGGGEIESVTIVTATPGSALITFEDSRVAQRVIQHSPHFLEMDGNKYKLIVAEHREKLDPDKVILSLSASVDYRQLPGGVTAFTSLHEDHPDIQINYDVAVKLYTLNGAYSKVQAALAQLLSHPEGPQSAEKKDSGQPSTGSVRITQTPRTQESQDQTQRPVKQRQKIHAGRASREHNTHRDLTPGGNSWEDTGQAEGAALQLPEPPATSEDDLLIVDADMFQYLQKHDRKEYEGILHQHCVGVVDMTNQGLTSLYLQVVTGVGEQGQGQGRLKLVRKALSSLFQDIEAKICRAQLPKCILTPRGKLEKVKEKLSVRLPKLLLNEDEQNIYIIGSSSDVTEAKHFLLDLNEARGRKEDVASLLRYPSYDSGSSTRADEQRCCPSTPSSVYSEDERIDQPLRSEEQERGAEGTKRYKMAPLFKDQGSSVLGSRPSDFRLRGGPSSPSRQPRVGPMLGHVVLSETADKSSERVSRALAQNTGGDILFKDGNVLPLAASMQSKTSSNSYCSDTRQKSVIPPFSTTPSSLSGSTVLPPAGSGSTLRRTSSFSGTPQQKAQVMGQKSQDDSGTSAVKARIRSSSFSRGGGKQEGYNAEITVPLVMWKHIKVAYSSQVDDLTSDVQMKESRSEGTSDLTITLRGANSSNVTSCQLGLQKLVSLVGVDFFVQELCLTELGITNMEDETLQACCAELRSKFKTVTIQILKSSLFLLGPKLLCSQVGAALQEVFSVDLAESASHQQDFGEPSTSDRHPSTFLQVNEDQGTSRPCYSHLQRMAGSQTSCADGTECSQESRTNKTSDFGDTDLVNGHRSVRTDPVVKEKGKFVEIDGQNTFVNNSTAGSNKSETDVNGVGSTPTYSEEDMTLDRNERSVQAPQNGGAQQKQPEMEARSGLGSAGCVCVCGKNQRLTTTKCGATLCSKCLDIVHVHCRVCNETKPTPQGILGKIHFSKLQIMVPGYKKNAAIKISYDIPDGIQKDNHPSPGQPYQGRLFEAYLPDCDSARKLLPRLREAFRRGFTFTVIKNESGSKVDWDCIPHKTRLQGGKPGNGYPDSTYLTRLSEVLSSIGIEEPPAKSEE